MWICLQFFVQGSSLKSDVDKLDIDKLRTAPTNLNNFETKVNEICVDKPSAVPVDLKTSWFCRQRW